MNSSAHSWAAACKVWLRSLPTTVSLACLRFTSKSPSSILEASADPVFRYMDLDPNEVGYFISQVGAAAASFGVSSADIQTVAGTLSSVFNVRCAPAVALVNNDAEYQSICVDKSCPLAPNAVCWKYPNNGYEPEPQSVCGGGYGGGGYGHN